MQYHLSEACVMFDEKELILEAKHVTRRFPAPNHRLLTACNDINLKLYKGKTLGLVVYITAVKRSSDRCLLGLMIPKREE